MSDDDLQKAVQAALQIYVKAINSVDEEHVEFIYRDVAEELIGMVKEQSNHVLDVENAANYFSAVHMYRPEGMTDGQVRTNATRERKMHGPATLVVQHMHDMSQPCNEKCKAKEFDDGE